MSHHDRHGPRRHHSRTVSDAVARPVRTGAQAVPAAVIVEFVEAFWVNLNDRQYAATVVLLTMVFSALQAAVENHTGKAFLRTVPPKQAKVVDTDDHPHF